MLVRILPIQRKFTARVRYDQGISYCRLIINGYGTRRC